MDEDLGKKINSAVFPGLQGGPLMHVIAAKAVAFGEALKPEFRIYAQRVLENARVMAARLVEHGFAIVSGGTDSHLMLVDLRPKKLTGNVAEKSLERAGLTCNKNGIPADPEKPMVTSGVRLGTPAGTTRGFGPAEFRQIADLIGETLNGLANTNSGDNAAVETAVRAKVGELARRFPEVHCLVMTVMEDRKAVMEALREGAAGYLLKRIVSIIFEKGSVFLIIVKSLVSFAIVIISLQILAVSLAYFMSFFVGVECGEVLTTISGVIGIIGGIFAFIFTFCKEAGVTVD
jgi:hypothetical protein